MITIHNINNESYVKLSDIQSLIDKWKTIYRNSLYFSNEQEESKEQSFLSIWNKSAINAIDMFEGDINGENDKLFAMWGITPKNQ